MPSDSESAVHRGEEEHHQRQQQQRRTLAATATTADDRNDADDGLIGGTFLWATRSGALFTCKSSALCVCVRSQHSLLKAPSSLKVIYLSIYSSSQTDKPSEPSSKDTTPHCQLSISQSQFSLQFSVFATLLSPQELCLFATSNAPG